MKIIEKIGKNRINMLLISFGMAIFLWSYVMGIVNPEIEMNHRGIELQFDGLDYVENKGLHLNSPLNQKVNVTIKGTRRDIKDINSNNLTATANLEGLSKGETRVNIVIGIKEQSGRITVLDVQPSSVIVNLEEIMNRQLTIDVEPLGELEEGYSIGNIRPVNSYVTVTGPESRLDTIKKVVTFVDVNSKTDTFMISSPIHFLDANGIELKDIQSNVNSVDVEVPIFKLKSVPIRLNFTGELNENEKVENIAVDPENVVIRGKKELINQIEFIGTAPIDYEAMRGSSEYNVTLQLPEGVSLHDSTISPKIKYNYLKNIQKNIVIPGENFTLQNESSNLNYNINTEFETITATFVGESSIIEDIVGSELVAYVDVKDLSPGEYMLEVSIEDMNNIVIRDVSPATVKVIISERNGNTTNGEALDEDVGSNGNN